MEQTKFVFGQMAFETIGGSTRVNKITNETYDITSKQADRRIEDNNREYAAMYKRAALFSAK